MIVFKVTKNQGFTLSLENTISEVKHTFTLIDLIYYFQGMMFIIKVHGQRHKIVTFIAYRPLITILFASTLYFQY